MNDTGNKKHNHIIAIISTVLFVSILLSLTVASVVIPDNAYSSEERRSLQQFPEFTFGRLVDGSFGSDINTYLNDQFAFRDMFVGLKCLSERLMLKRENNGVLIGKNGQMAVRLFSAVGGKLSGSVAVDYFDKETVQTELESVKELSERLAEKNVQLSVLLPPRTIDVACSAFDYPTAGSDALISAVRESLEGKVNFVDVYDIFRTRYDNGEYVYFRTDHHWTELGAYYAYVEVMKSFGMDYYDISDFDIHTAVTDFRGTVYSKAGNKTAEADTIEYWTLKNDSSVYVMDIYDGKSDSVKTSAETMLDMSYLETSDKYSMFLSGTNTQTRIYRKDGEKRETLIILKDSFGHSLAPFLALHFDLVVIDLAEWNGLSAKNVYDADKMLICYNLENVITTTRLVNVRGASRLIVD